MLYADGEGWFQQKVAPFPHLYMGCQCPSLFHCTCKARLVRNIAEYSRLGARGRVCCFSRAPFFKNLSGHSSAQEAERAAMAREAQKQQQQLPQHAPAPMYAKNPRAFVAANAAAEARSMSGQMRS